jgi:hypothetical protein
VASSAATSSKNRWHRPTLSEIEQDVDVVEGLDGRVYHGIDVFVYFDIASPIGPQELLN